MVKKLVVIFVTLAFVFAGCSAFPMDPDQTGATPAQGDPNSPVTNETPDVVKGQRSPLDPLPDEDKMSRASASVVKSEILMLESYPMQITLTIEGTLPTPCHHLRAKVNPPDADNHINVEVYSMVDPGEICIQVLQEYKSSIPLGSYEAGTYTIMINGQKAGEFTQ